MSTHSVNVIEVTEILPHGNAERLEIVPVGGWQAIVAKGQFAPGDRAIYIEPDYTVPVARPEFSFLAKHGRERHRLKAIRLRGVLSYGLLIPVPDELKDRDVGADVMVDLDIQRYEPPEHGGSGPRVLGADALPLDQWPQVSPSKFDVESLQKYRHVIEVGEPVLVTEKIHGANARFVWHNDQFYIGSRSRWLKPDADSSWKRAVDFDPRIEAWCKDHPEHLLYGEIYGSVQSLKYGAEPGAIHFAAFAVNYGGEWIDTGALLEAPVEKLATVPLLYFGPYTPDVLALAEEDSSIGGSGHMREGIVIVPQHERFDRGIGRVIVKHISNRYWESEA